MVSDAEAAVVNYWTHGPANNRRPHEWLYLGRVKQAYYCRICQLQVTKAALKEGTDVS